MLFPVVDVFFHHAGALVPPDNASSFFSTTLTFSFKKIETRHFSCKKLRIADLKTNGSQPPHGIYNSD